MLLQLHQAGFEIFILGATVFDHERGQILLDPYREKVEANKGKLLNVKDDPLIHHLLVTAHWDRQQMRNHEITTWHNTYCRVLDEWQPDIVWYYGGNAADYLIANEAKYRGIATAAYLVNGSYNYTRWCRDVDVIITDSQATAALYKDRLGLDLKAVGKFIPAQQYLAPHHERKHLLFINPSLAKGAAIVVQLAVLLEQRRPDIKFEVVESRGNWQEVVEQVTEAQGNKRMSLDNVILTPNTDDMRPVYGRARLLLAPSLWWESGARVLAESMINGIPAIVTDSGGSSEMIQNGGITFQLPKACHQAPYASVPSLELYEPLVKMIIELYDDETVYQGYVARARQVGTTLHAIETSTRRLVDVMRPLLSRGGDLDIP